MKLREFILKNSIIIALWSTTIISIGWFIGKSSAIAFKTFENIYVGIALTITGLIIANIIIKKIGKKIIFKVEHRKI